MHSLASISADPWLRLWLAFASSLAVVLALEWAWQRLWAVFERGRFARCPVLRGNRGFARRALILACVFVISAALTFAR